MRKQPSPELLEFLAKVCEAYGLPPGTGVHVNMPIVCDRCLDEDKEAFPYNARGYPHLCNECWEEVVGMGEGSWEE